MSQICLPCAREILSGQPKTKCHECKRLSADPLAAIREATDRKWSKFGFIQKKQEWTK